MALTGRPTQIRHGAYRHKLAGTGAEYKAQSSQLRVGRLPGVRQGDTEEITCQALERPTPGSAATTTRLGGYPVAGATLQNPEVRPGGRQDRRKHGLPRRVLRLPGEDLHCHAGALHAPTLEGYPALPRAARLCPVHKVLYDGKEPRLGQTPGVKDLPSRSSAQAITGTEGDCGRGYDHTSTIYSRGQATDDCTRVQVPRPSYHTG